MTFRRSALHPLGRLSRLAGLATSALLGCGGHGSTTPHGGDAPAIRLMPLAMDNVWTYDAYDQDGNGPTLAAIRVTDAQEGRYTVSSLLQADSAERYEVREDGIYLPDSRGWLLQDPVVVGSSWSTRGGRRAEVVDTNVTVTVPRGTFEGCVRVDEDGGELEVHVETIYCVDVGVVSTRSSMHSDLADMTLTQRAELREYVVETASDDG